MERGNRRFVQLVALKILGAPASTTLLSARPCGTMGGTGEAGSSHSSGHKARGLSGVDGVRFLQRLTP